MADKIYKTGYKINPTTGRCIKIGGPTDKKNGENKKMINSKKKKHKMTQSTKKNNVRFSELIGFTVVDVFEKEVSVGSCSMVTIIKMMDKNGNENGIVVGNDPMSNDEIFKYEEICHKDDVCHLCEKFGAMTTVDNPDYKLNSIFKNNKKINICSECIANVECPHCKKMYPSYTCYYKTNNVIDCCNKCNKEKYL